MAMAEIHPTAIVYPGTVLGEGVKVLEHAVVGKQPTLSPRSTAKRDPLPPAEIGAGTIVSTGAVVFAGTQIGERAILCPGIEIGEDAFVGAGAVVTKDVEPRMLVVGNPARVLRAVSEDELLENQ